MSSFRQFRFTIFVLLLSGSLDAVMGGAESGEGNFAFGQKALLNSKRYQEMKKRGDKPLIEAGAYDLLRERSCLHAHSLRLE